MKQESIIARWRDWLVANLWPLRVLVLIFAALNVWSASALFPAHPYLGAANGATAALLVWLVVITWGVGKDR